MTDKLFDHDRMAPAEAARRLAERHAARMALPTAHLDPAPSLDTDTLWRGLLREGQARLLVVRATATVDEAARRIGCSPDVARMLGEWMVGALLVRSTLNPDDRLQLFVDHEGPVGRVTIDAWQQGGVRAYVARPHEELRAFGFLVGAGNLQVSRTSAGRSYSSVVALDGDCVDDFLMNYLLESEQILSLVRSDVAVGADGRIARALGYLIQLMPEGGRGDLARIAANLTGAPALGDGMTAADPDGRLWAEGLLDGFKWDQVAREPVAFRCRCSRDRMLSMLSSLPRRDLADLAHGSEPLELVCDYCGDKFQVRPAELRALFVEPS